MLNQLERELRGGLPPERVAYLTFTRVARHEATERAMLKFNFARERLRYFATLHSIAYQSLGLNQSMVLSRSDQLRDFGSQFGFQFGFKNEKHYLDEDEIFQPGGDKNGDKYLAFYNWMQHKMLDFETAYRKWPNHDLPYFESLQFCKAYQRFKFKEGLLDFTDFLIKFETPLDVEVVFVDEAQDLSNLQWSALGKMAAHAKRIYVAGDDDQAIFSWAGAAPEVFIDLPGSIDVLPKSYRMPRSVFDLSQRMVKKIVKRQAKTFNPREALGRIETYHAFHDIEIVSPEQPYTGAKGQRMPWRVLVRNNYLKSDIISDLKMRGVPFSNTGHSAVSPDTVACVHTWDSLLKGKSVRLESAAQMYELMTTNFKVKHGSKARIKNAVKGEPDKLVSMDELRKQFGLLAGNEPWYEAFTMLTDDENYYIRTMVRRRGIEALSEKPWLDISTIHGAKGAEADNVVLLTDMSSRCHRNLIDDRDAEMRVWYTGVTRAAESLHIVGMNDMIFR
jgi:DNA helicase-2/ATP-dependent DNA helicase PcrA